MKTAAVIPAKGIGDALLMMIASHHLLERGYQVTTYHPALGELQEWFVGHQFAPLSAELDLFAHDLVIVENDNSARVKKLIQLAQEKKYKRLSIFYPTHVPNKNAPLSPIDQVFCGDLPMTDNIAKSIAKLLKRKGTSKNNGLKVPGEFTHRQFASRIVIHPTSSTPQKNWSRDKYLALADMLRKLGYTVTFVVGPHEAKDWKEATVFANLHTLATFIYESGYLIGNDSLLGHLASNLNIPTLIISDNRTRMHMWRPGWLKGEVLTPPSWLPNMKFLRLRENHWQKFISPRAVLSAFDNLTRSL